MILERKDKIDIFENAISWIVVMAMLVYGGAKIIQFEGALDIEKSVNNLSGRELMWAFYGYSRSFVLILGVLEITGGLLILIKRTRLIGCMFTSAILINIILQDIFYEIPLGALKAAIIYQLIILVILYLNKKLVLNSLRELIHLSKDAQSIKKSIVKLGIAFALFSVLRVLEYFVTIKW